MPIGLMEESMRCWGLCLALVAGIGGCASLHPAATNVRDGDPRIYLLPSGEAWIGFDKLPRWRRVEFRGPGFVSAQVEVYCVGKTDKWAAEPNGGDSSGKSTYDSWKICSAKQKDRERNTRLRGAIIAIAPSNEPVASGTIAEPMTHNSAGGGKQALPAAPVIAPDTVVTGPTEPEPATVSAGTATASSDAPSSSPVEPSEPSCKDSSLGFDGSDAVCIDRIGCSRPEVLRGYRSIKHLQCKKTAGSK